MLRARAATLDRMRATLAGADLFVFTLGLTEAWLNARDGTVYPMCPGTIRGRAINLWPLTARLQRHVPLCGYFLASIAACRYWSNGVWALSPTPHCLPSTNTVGVPVMPITVASWVVCFTHGR